ncbi:MAG TPA: hypothetical protein VNR60_09625 [Croceibacterium sp.]|nr:hypothetical protein [Croceibacterium sp.]
MKPTASALFLLLACSACSQQDAPAEELAETAEQIVMPTPTPLAAGPLAPRDTCATVAGADDFRAQLADAVKRRDADAFAALAAQDIKLDFGGGASSAELRKRLEDKSWDLWNELDELMALGCSANAQGGITIPWFFDQDLGRINPVSGWLVTGERVPVLSAPDPDSAEVATISWSVVELTALDPERDYQQVQLSDKQQGFIATDKLRSVIDYRLIASSRNGRWRITSFVAGD